MRTYSGPQKETSLDVEPAPLQRSRSVGDDPVVKPDLINLMELLMKR